MIVDADLPDHPKVHILARMLQIDPATVPTILIRLWGHCQHRRSDQLAGDPLEAAVICRWPGDETVFVQAMIKARWLDQNDAGFVVHGWRERNSAWLSRIEGGKQRAANARRMGNGQLANSKAPRTKPSLTSTQPASKPNAGGVEWSGVESNPPIVPQGGQERAEDSRAEPLADTITFLCDLFGRKKNRLGYEAEQQLSRFAEMLPLDSLDKALLRWFKSQPEDDRDFQLRGRPDTAEGWAKNLPGMIERAKKCAANRGGPVSTAAPAQVTPDPEGWREIFAKKYPRAEPPAAFAQLDERIQREVKTAIEEAAA